MDTPQCGVYSEKRSEGILRTMKQSNLWTEIMEYTSPDKVARIASTFSKAGSTLEHNLN